jgi:hypothetical protein
MLDFDILSLNENDMPDLPLSPIFPETIDDLFVNLYNQNTNVSFTELKEKLINYYNNEATIYCLEYHVSEIVNSDILNESEHAYIMDQCPLDDYYFKYNLTYLITFISTPMGENHLNYIYNRKCL